MVPGSRRCRRCVYEWKSCRLAAALSRATPGAGRAAVSGSRVRRPAAPRRSVTLMWGAWGPWGMVARRHKRNPSSGEALGATALTRTDLTVT